MATNQSGVDGALDVTVAVRRLFAEPEVITIASDQARTWSSLGRCPACASEYLHALTNVEAESGDVFLQKSLCVACGHVFFSRMPDASFFADYYTHRFARANPAPAVAPDYSYAALSDVLRERVDATARVLDVGCGYGAALKHFERLGFANLLGLEPSTSRAAVALRSGLQVLNIPLEQLSPELHGRFDCVYSWHAFEHIVDLDAAIERVKSVLVPGGHLLIAVPHMEAEHIVKMAHFLPHIHNFNEHSLHVLLTRHGFQVVHADNTIRVLGQLRAGKHVGERSPASASALNRKFLRDFDLRAHTFTGPIDGWLGMSRYRGSDQILEPSFGELHTSQAGSAPSAFSAHIPGVDWALQRPAVKRVWRRLFGRYIAGRFAVSERAGDFSSARFIHPGTRVSVFLK